MDFQGTESKFFRAFGRFSPYVAPNIRLAHHAVCGIKEDHGFLRMANEVSPLFCQFGLLDYPIQQHAAVLTPID